MAVLDLRPTDGFTHRHLGPRAHEVDKMLAVVGVSSMAELIAQAIPASIREDRRLEVPEALGEREAAAALAQRAARNEVRRSYLGMGYHGTVTPPVILRNVLQDPGWYTAYTPYQAEIAQGRLEALVAFETMVQDLTGMEVSNASLLDEGTAAAEAMAMCLRVNRKGIPRFFVSEHCHPQTIAVVQTRAEPLDIEVFVGNPATFDFSVGVSGALLQYPHTDGELVDPSAVIAEAKAHGALVVVACDLLALTLLRTPHELGADIAVGNSQRFGVPMGYGGPHAAFLACDARHARKMPGRIIGLSRDRMGRDAYRMTMQTREQHIRRDKATSNVCTSQVLLAVVAAMYAVYHGPDGLKAIAHNVHARTAALAAALTAGGLTLRSAAFFDTLTVELGAGAAAVRARADAAGVNLRYLADGAVSVALDETVTDADLVQLIEVFGVSQELAPAGIALPEALRRTSLFLQHEVFQRYRSETEMLRYLGRLKAKDLALDTAMIPLGSCTMKLNATTEMMGIHHAGFADLHPFVPVEQAPGYQQMLRELEGWLCEITGYDAVSLQPNAGSQGEYAGLLVIRRYHQAQGESHRNVCLIPTSAHGTNPASAVMAGLKVIGVACDDDGNIDVEDLRAKAAAHSASLAALMVTYPSTHGVFEESIREICGIVHEHGGQVYLDGANLNAMVGLCRPGKFGADVSHLNLHKTFAIPHGGGGPGMGPIGVGAHLAPHLPNHPVVASSGDEGIGPISAAPWGSASILPISWAYVAMLGPDGLRAASETAILAANYVAKRLEGHFDVLYTGRKGRVAHECIIDVRPFKAAGIEVTDVAKRLMDYGFHGPTMSWPVSGTLMIEPTESESLVEIDRFCDAMIAIRGEIRRVAEGEWPQGDNPLVNSPHTMLTVCGDTWAHPYSRDVAAFPTAHTRNHKFWPSVSRVEDAWGDRHLCTTFPPHPKSES